MRVPILDLGPEIQRHWKEFNEAIQKVLLSGEFIQGSETKAFEAEAAAYLGVKHAIGLNSGTDALVIALRSLGIGPGHEVITTGFTFYATAEAVSLVGAEPVFVDIDPETFNLDVAQVERHITDRTRALLPVHLFGQGCDLAPLMELAESHGLSVIEDTAQAFGADYRKKKLGTWGQLGTFSFFPSKNLGALGDGGLVTTNDDALAEMCRMLSNHGSKKRYYNEMLGYNSRLDSIQAAILRVKLKYVDVMNRSRQEVARRYAEKLAGIDGIGLPSLLGQGTHVYHQFTIRLENGIRDDVQASLAEEGISTMVYYPLTVPNLKVYSRNVPLPNAQKACDEVLSLPIWPEMDLAIQDRVINALERAVQKTPPKLKQAPTVLNRMPISEKKDLRSM